MADHKEEHNSTTSQHNDAAVKPEPETLHTPDPQDKMEGPISSLVQDVKKGLEDDKTKTEADNEKDRKM